MIAGTSFSHINWEEETVFEVVKSITLIVIVASEKQEETDPEYARTVTVAPSVKAPPGVKVAIVEEAPWVNPLTKNS